MKATKIRSSYGIWKSPFTPQSMGRESANFMDLAWNRDGALVWLERQSDRSPLLVRPADGQAWRELNSVFSAGAGLNYGGAEFSVSQDCVFFVDAKSKRIYRQPLATGEPQPVSPAFGVAAAPEPSPDGRWLLFLHSYEEKDSIEIVDAQGVLWPQKLVFGDDFYMHPVWHPGGQYVAWVAWNTPNMPWDGSFLRMGKLRYIEGSLPVLEKIETIAGSADISVMQPQFSPDGRYLAYISDESGWWQIYLLDMETRQTRQLTYVPAEHGTPAWVQGLRNYDFSPDGRWLYFLRNQAGFVSLWQLELTSGQERQLSVGDEYTFMKQVAVSPDGQQIALIASGAATPERLIVYRLNGGVQVIRRTAAENLPAAAYSQSQLVEWPGMDRGTAYGLYFPPQNDGFESSGQPPLVVRVHGGPTSQAYAAFNLPAQFFTSRGYAFLEVNHRGSTGFGRAYRNMLRGNWGIYDVQDAVSGARSLAERGWVDDAHMVILGGSAGGFTVLKTLEDYPGVFKAGICMYPVVNQFIFEEDTHKFELHYNDTLLGLLPDAAAVYRERSPIFYADKIQDALIIFQGENDPVCPFRHTEKMVEALRHRKVMVDFHVYPGEGHGFRKAATIEHFYKTVDEFLRHNVVFA